MREKLRMPSVSFLCLIVGAICIMGPPTLVTGTDVPKDQREAVAQIMGFIFIVGAIIMTRLDAKFRHLQEEDQT